MSEYHLYCYDCERQTPHSDYGTRDVVAICDVCEIIRYLPTTNNEDNDDNQYSEPDEQRSLVEAGA